MKTNLLIKKFILTLHLLILSMFISGCGAFLGSISKEQLLNQNPGSTNLIVVQPPVAKVQVNEVAQVSIEGGVPPYVFDVLDGSGSVNASGVNYNASSAIPGLSTVRVTDSKGAIGYFVLSTSDTLSLVPASKTMVANSIFPFRAVGGMQPYIYSVVSGSAAVNPVNGDVIAGSSPGIVTIKVVDASGAFATSSLTITSPLSLSPGSTAMLINGNKTFIASGGLPPYTYSIESGGGSIDATSGVYTAPGINSIATIKVVDILGNSQISTVEIVNPISISPASSIVYVNGTVNFIALGGKGPYTYALSAGTPGTINAATGFYVAPATSGGPYNLTVTDSLGNTAVGSLTVSNAVVFSLSSFSVQTNGSVDVGTFISGGVPPYTYSVSAGQGSFSGSIYTAPATAGLYTVTAMDSSSPVPLSVRAKVQVYSPLSLSPATATISVNRKLNLAASGGVPPYTYSVSGSGSVVSGVYQAPGTPGTETVTVTDSKGGSASSLITINPALVVTPSIASTPKNQPVALTVTGGVAPYTYSVISGTGTVNASGVFTAPNQVESDVVLVTDSTGDSLNVQINVLDSLIVAPANPSVNKGGTIAFTALGGVAPYTYSVTSGGGSFSSNTYQAPATAGSAVVTISDSLGATKTVNISIYDSLQVTPLSTSVALNTPVTFGGVGGTPPYTFSVSSGVGVINPSTGSYTSATAGTAIIQITDNVGTTATGTITVVDPLSVTPATANLAVGAQQAFTVTGGLAPYTYAVASGGGGFSSNVFTAPNTQGASTLTVTDSRGTSVSVSVATVEPLQISPLTTSAHTFQNISFTASKGKSPYTYSVTSGPGSINAATGAYSSSSAGLANIQVTDALGATASAAVNVSGPLVVSPTSATVNINASQSITVSGGASPYLYSVQSGGGVFIGGLYQAPATSTSAVIRVTDQFGDYVDIPVVVQGPLNISPQNTFAYINVPVNFTALGGTPPYTFSKVSGVGSINPVNGQFMSSAAGSAVVRVTDNTSGTIDANVVVGNALQISPASSSIAVGQTQSFSASGGVAPYTYSVVSGLGSIDSSSGVYTAVTSTGSVTVKVTDSYGNTSNATISVQAAAPVQMAFTSAAQTIASGVCSGQVSIQTQDTYGNPSNVTTDTIIALSASGALFYTTADCSGSAVSSVTITTGNNTGYFYLKGTTAGALSVMASGTGLGLQFQVETIQPGTPSYISSVPSSSTIVAGACATLDLRIKDGFGNLTTSATDTVLPLVGSQVSFYNSLDCSGGVITSATITAGQSQGHISFIRTLAGSTAVGVTPPSGLSNSGFTLTVNAAAAAKVLLSAVLNTNENVNQNWGVQPAFAIADTYGNTVTTATNAVTLALYSDSSCTTSASGTLSASANPVSASSGIATFSGVKYSGTWGAVYVSGQASGLTKSCSAAVNVLPDLSSSQVLAPIKAPNDATAVSNIVIIPKNFGVNLGTGLPVEVTSSSANVVFSGGTACAVPAATCRRATDGNTGAYLLSVTNTTAEVVTFTMKIATSPQVSFPNSFTVDFNTANFTVVTSAVTWTSAPTPSNVFVKTGATITFDTTASSVTLGDVFMTAGTIKHTATTTGAVYRVNLNVNTLNLLGGSINVSGLGYPTSAGQGSQWATNDTVGSWTAWSYGGTHAGVGGGSYNSVYSNGKPYDNYRNPNFPGGAGADSSSPGGGVIRITSTGLCTVNSGATILANGNNASAGGAGGSIYLNCAGFAGTAGANAIRAIGGNASGSNSGYGYGGGSGGMISLISTGDISSFSGSFVYPSNTGTLTNFKSIINAIGGTGAGNTVTGGAGAAGTVYLQHSGNAAYGGDLIVDNGATSTWNTNLNGRTTIPAFAGTVSAKTASQITINPTSTPALSSTWDKILVGRQIRPNVAYDNGTPNDYSDDNIMTVTANNSTSMTVSGGNMSLVNVGDTLRSIEVFDHLYVGVGAILETNGDIYARNGSIDGPSTTSMNAKGLIIANSYYPQIPDPYNNLTGVFVLPSGYALSMSNDWTLSNAVIYGGVVNTGNITLNSSTVSGSTVTAGNISINTGTLSATTLNATSLTSTNGTLNLGTANVSGNVSLTTGSSTITNLTSNNATLVSGTQNISNLTTNALVINGGTNSIVTGNLASVNITGGTTTAQNLTASGAFTMSSGTLNHPATTGSTVYRLILNVGSFSLTGGSLNVSGLGYVTNGGQGAQWATNDTIGNWTAWSYGGTHAGVGGGSYNSVYSNGKPYDNYRNPNFPGGAGADSTSPGGGVIRITSTGLCTVNSGATILANGNNASAGGAGGSIYLNCAGFAGTASANAIRAIGGNASGSNSGYGYGGGSGGMISIISSGDMNSFSGSFVYPSNTGTLTNFKSIVNAIGGTGFSTTVVGGAGAAGTVYLQHSGNAAFGGDLIVDNGTTSTWNTNLNGRTTIPAFAGTVSAKSGSQITINPTSTPALSSTWDRILAGRQIRPNVAYDNGTPNDYSDDNVMTVTTNNSTSLTVTGGDLALVNVGDTLRSIEVFDHLYVGVGAVLETNGDIYARNGSIDNPSTTSMNAKGFIIANSYYPQIPVPYNNLTGVFVLPSGYSISMATDWTLNNAIVYGATITAPNVILNSSTLSGTTLNLADVTMSSGTLSGTTVTAGNISLSTGTISATNLTASSLTSTNGTLNIGTANISGNVSLTTGTSTISNLTANNTTIVSGTQNITNITTNALAINGGTNTITTGNLATCNITGGTNVAQNLTASGAFTMSAGTLKHPATTTSTAYRLILNVGSFSLTGGSINLNGLGYVYNGGSNEWAANDTVAATLGGGWGPGGNHAGNGGGFAGSYTSGKAYDNYRSPNFPGGAGGDTGSTGGGVVRITSAGLCTINSGATITATGNGVSAGGAGGSIYMKCSGFTGTATANAIVANGSTSVGGNGSNGYGGGSGGMIALISTGNISSFAGSFVYPSNAGTLTNFRSIVSAIGGNGKSNTVNGGAGAAGTIFVQHSDNAAYGGDLIVDNGATASWVSTTNGKTKLTSFTGTVAAKNATQITISPTSTPNLSSTYDAILVGRQIRPSITYDNGTANDYSDDNIMNATGNNSTSITVTGGDTSLVNVGDTLRNIEIFDHIYVGTGTTFETQGDLYIRNGGLTSPSTTQLVVPGTVTVGGAMYPPL